jgi:type IV pilus assembly protein PilB
MALGKKFLARRKKHAAAQAEAADEILGSESLAVEGTPEGEDFIETIAIQPEAPKTRSLDEVDFDSLQTGAEAVERKPLGQILKELRLVTESQIQEASAIQRQRGGALGTILVNLNYVTEQEVLKALGVQAGMEVVDLDSTDIPDEIIARVTPSVATVYRVVPAAFENGVLTIAMADPLNVKTLDDLRFLLDADIQGAVSDEGAVARALDRYYAGVQESVESLLSELDDGTMADFVGDASESIDLETLEEMADAAPVRKLLNYVLLVAIRDKAADIHFEPFEDEFKIRYRIDGVLYEMVPPPKQLALAIASRIKVMADLDIAERRLPQDGRVELNISGNPVELRVSILPTMFGESCVLRVLDRSVVKLDVNNLGFREDDMAKFHDILGIPNGIVLVTGPTGSGKTTTLYAALNSLNDISHKIITTEDPVEYDLDGVIQVQIRADIGLTFGACLRSILRQDPDIVLVGEIRDVETAKISIEASLTGHIVFSTLHTNDAPSTVTRLIDMGVESYLITATLEAIIAQRLVRRICERCKREFTPTEDMLMELNMTPAHVRGKRFTYGPGCDHCNNTGYRGRMAIFEILSMDDEIREIIVGEGSTLAIREAAIRKGMRALRDSGLLAIYDGETTIEEVVRETLLAEG